MNMRAFLNMNIDACREGREEGLCYSTVEDWWDHTERADFMAWVLAKTGKGDLEICKQIHLETIPDLVEAGLSVDPSTIVNTEADLGDYLFFFYNYSVFNLRDPKWADRMRELMGNPFRGSYRAEDKG